MCLGLALLVAGALLGTSLRPGYALYLDHVTVPTPAAPNGQSLSSAAGLRAWPLDGVVWLWSLALPTWLLQHLILLGSLVGAGAGAGLLLRHRGALAMSTATLLAMVNPYVVERLLLGQPALLLAYASLPWVVIASRQATVGRRLAFTTVALLPAALTPWGAVVAGTAAVLVVVIRRRKCAEILAQVAISLALWLPWLMPALSGPSSAADPAGATAFRLADDVGLGVFFSALVGGGVWSESATLPARLGPVGVAGTIALVALAAVGLLELLRTSRWAASALGLTAVGVPLLTALLSGPLLTPWTVLQGVPGVALFRDLHRMLAPSVLAMVLLTAIGVTAVVRRAAGGYTAPGVILAFIVPVALTVVLAPGAPDRVRAAYDPRSFSAEWPTVMSTVDSGRVLSLPWQPLRRVEWMPQAFQDPSPKALAGRVLVDRTLTVARDGTLIRVEEAADAEASDDTLGAWLVRGLGDPIPSSLLAGSGIDHVMIWKDSPGTIPLPPLGWTETFSGSDFRVWSNPHAATR